MFLINKVFVFCLVGDAVCMLKFHSLIGVSIMDQSCRGLVSSCFLWGSVKDTSKETNKFSSCPSQVSIDVMKDHDQKARWRGKCFIWLILPHHCSSLQEV